MRPWPSTRLRPFAAIALASSVLAQGVPFEGRFVPDATPFWDLGAHDWTGDGVLDFVGISDVVPGTLLFPGVGDGTVAPPTDVGLVGRYDAVVDVDGDGDPDLVDIPDYVAGTPNQPLRVTLWDGGAVAAIVESPLAVAAPLELFEDVAFVDLEADGDLDALVLGVDAIPPHDSRLVVLHGDGTGAFVEGPSHAVGPQAQDVLVGNFEGDGALEVLVTSAYSPFLSRFLLDGSGGLLAGADVAVGSGQYAARAVDLDGDGYHDVVASFREPSPVLALLGTGVLTSDGAGGFTQTSFQPDTRRNELLVGDVDGDGDFDLVDANQQVLRNDGGTLTFAGSATGHSGQPRYLGPVGAGVRPCLFLERSSLSPGYAFVLGGGAVPMDGFVELPEHWIRLAGDFDGDAVDDLVAIRDSEVTVLLRPGSIDPPPVTFLDVGFGVEIAVTLDWNGDGALDVAVGGRDEFADERLLVLLGDGAGALVVGPGTIVPDDVGHLFAEDLGNDGAVELLTVGPSGAYAYPRESDGSLGGPTWSDVAPASSADLGDLDGDGIVDLARPALFGLRIYFGDGTGSFSWTESVPYGVFGPEGWVLVVDLDGQGAEELVLSSGGGLRILRREAGSFQVVDQLGDLHDARGVGAGAPSLSLGDFDADGVLDLVTGHERSTVVPLAADGTLGEPVLLDFFAWRSAIGDFDGDGFEDLVTGGPTSIFHAPWFDVLFPNPGYRPTGVEVLGAGTPGCAGTHLAFVSGAPNVGATEFALTCDDAPPRSFGLLFLSDSTIPAGAPVLGALLHVVPAGPLFSVAVVSSTREGRVRVPVPIPDLPGLAGTTVAAQFAWFWPGTVCSPSVSGWSSSRGLELVLQD